MRSRIIVMMFIWTLCSVDLYSQTPSGYMGKRLIVNYNHISFPQLYNSLVEGELVFRQKHNIEFEYITRRHAALGISFAFHQFETNLINYTFDNFAQANTNSWEDNISPVDKNTLSVNSSKYFGIYYRISHSNVAPLGTFSRFGIDQIVSNISIQNQRTSQDTSVYIPSIISDDQYFSFMISYGIGTQRIIFDKILLRFAVQSGFVFGGLKQTRTEAADGIFDFFDIFSELTDGGTDRYNYMKRITKNSLLNQNIISVTLGIGLLVY